MCKELRIGQGTASRLFLLKLEFDEILANEVLKTGFDLGARMRLEAEILW